MSTVSAISRAEENKEREKQIDKQISDSDSHSGDLEEIEDREDNDQDYDLSGFDKIEPESDSFHELLRDNFPDIKGEDVYNGDQSTDGEYIPEVQFTVDGPIESSVIVGPEYDEMFQYFLEYQEFLEQPLVTSTEEPAAEEPSLSEDSADDSETLYEINDQLSSDLSAPKFALTVSLFVFGLLVGLMSQNLLVAVLSGISMGIIGVSIETSKSLTRVSNG